MPGRLQRANLDIEGFVIVSVHSVGENFHIPLRSRCSVGTCPGKSRYERRPSDLPLSGRRVIFLIEARRFWCDMVVCGRSIFCEQSIKAFLIGTVGELSGTQPIFSAIDTTAAHLDR